MKITPIKNEKQYEEYLQRAYSLMQKDIKPDTDESDELELLTLLINEYEDENYPIPAPDPLEAIKFRLEQMGVKESYLSSIIGSTRKSEIMSGKRKLNLSMIRKLSEKLHISADILIRPY